MRASQEARALRQIEQIQHDIMMQTFDWFPPFDLIDISLTHLRILIKDIKL